MAMSKELKAAINAKLKLGVSVKTISEQHDVKIPTIYVMKRKLDKEADNEVVSDVCDVPTEMVHHIVDEAKKAKPDLAPALDKVVDGIDGLKKLESRFHETATLGLSRLNSFLQDESTKLSEVQAIMSTIGNTYEKIFSSGTNIHIGDNNSHSTQQLTIFKNKQGV